MELILGQKFENETICFDGFNFVGCTFVNCLLIVTDLSFNFERCSFYNSSFHVKTGLPVFEIAHRLSQSTCGSDTSCFWTNVYKGTNDVLELPAAKK